MRDPEYFTPPNFRRWLKAPHEREKITNTPFFLQWFKDHPYLGYSVQNNWVLCRSCSMGCGVGIKRPSRTTEALISIPLSIMETRRMKEAIADHGKRNYHIAGMQQCATFIEDDLTTQPSKIEPQIYRTLHAGLTSIVKTVIFLARQGLYFLGNKAVRHSAEDQKSPMFASPEWKYGNFDALLKFRIDSGDKDLEQYFRLSGKRSQYVHITVQNKILQLAGEAIQKQILDEVSPY